jgi:hypothetical protein
MSRASRAAASPFNEEVKAAHDAEVAARPGPAHGGGREATYGQLNQTAGRKGRA